MVLSECVGDCLSAIGSKGGRGIEFAPSSNPLTSVFFSPLLPSVSGLRRRLLNLFLQFIETPEFNPEAKRLMEVHQDKVCCCNVHFFFEFQILNSPFSPMGNSISAQRERERECVCVCV